MRVWYGEVAIGMRREKIWVLCGDTGEVAMGVAMGR